MEVEVVKVVKEINRNWREEKEIISKRSKKAKPRKVEKEEEKGGGGEMEASQLLLQSSPQHFGELPF